LHLKKLRILFGGHNNCHEKKETEYIPYPVKEHGWDSGHMDMNGVMGHMEMGHGWKR
jgi:hypothetical protein